MRHLLVDLASMGFEATDVSALAGDASTRRFYRATLVGADTVVVAEYRPGEEAAAARDAATQRWGLERALPLPSLLAHGGRLVVSSDLGDTDLDSALHERGPRDLSLVIDALGAFQAAPWREAPTPPFDAAFFRAELAAFEKRCPHRAAGPSGPTARFLDDLALRLAGHPFRLVHRDFHANNVFLAGDRAWTVDFQDLRGGPDTYDLASLLRERAGAELSGGEEADWRLRAAAAFSWPSGWERRYTECAAQRGLKVIETFLRLAAAGRPGYLRWLPAVRRRTVAALRALAAPSELLDRVATEERG